MFEAGFNAGSSKKIGEEAVQLSSRLENDESNTVAATAAAAAAAETEAEAAASLIRHETR